MTTEAEQTAMDHFNQQWEKSILLNTNEAKAFERALVAVAYWLDCSPHEQTPEDAIAMAEFIRMIAPRIGTPVRTGART
jgi:hypothetical protein